MIHNSARDEIAAISRAVRNPQNIYFENLKIMGNSLYFKENVETKLTFQIVIPEDYPYASPTYKFCFGDIALTEPDNGHSETDSTITRVFLRRAHKICSLISHRLPRVFALLDLEFVRNNLGQLE
ncbi:unnamed protein product [Hymenolepis diminuta]|uniref:Uncharacterized protein n=1 Tax=Hymenolepis diminuta TaxID=6216 RepID=A0A564Z824_HYMDI|nr:unnamed protein product [Hymenolepis diminuta]